MNEEQDKNNEETSEIVVILALQSTVYILFGESGRPDQMDISSELTR